MEEIIELIKCRHCGQQKPASRYTPGLCEDCEKAYNNRYSYLRQQNANWMDIAKDSGLEIWERQPGETQLEWSIWQAYRDSYPGAKPSYRKVTDVVDTTYHYVQKVASRWNYNVRMQAWITYCDGITLAQRRQEVLDLNKEHIAMAAKLRAKLNAAIELIDPTSLKPSELNGLLRTVTELEKKAQVDNVAIAEKQIDEQALVDNPEIKKSQTKQSDLGEVVSILLQAGALGDITQIGVRKTETTEVVMRGDD